MAEECEPLLPQLDRRSTGTDFASKLSFIPLKFYQSKILRNMLKSMTAFALTAVLPFVNAAHPYLGFSSHMAAIAILFFNPCKSIGGMFESVVMGIFGVAFGSLVSMGGIAVWTCVKPSLLKIFLLISLIFISSFTLSFLRSRSSRQPVYTGTVIAHIVMFTILTGPELLSSKGDHETVDILIEKLKYLDISILFGAFISLLVSVLLWPKSASVDLRKDVRKTLQLMETLMNMIVTSFVSNGVKGESNNLIEIDKKMEQFQAMFVSISQINSEANLEMTKSFRDAKQWSSLISSLNRLSRHLGGMRSGLQRLHKRPVADPTLLSTFLANSSHSLISLSHSCKESLRDADIILQSSTFWNNLLLYLRIRSAKHHVQRLRVASARIDEAIRVFNHEHHDGLMKMYETKAYDGRPADEIFLVYYFIFSLMEFSKEIEHAFIPKVGNVANVRTEINTRRSAIFSWFVEEKDEESQSDDEEFHECVDDIKTTEKDSRYIDFIQSQAHGIYHPYIKSRPLQDNRRNDTELKIPLVLKYRLKIWQLLSNLQKSFNLKFALKTALLVCCLASMAFMPETAGLFQDYRMSWTLISVVVVIQPTIGGTNAAGLYRILGTTLGAVYSFGINYLVKTVLRLNYDLEGKWAIYGLIVLFALPCMFVFLFSKYPRAGQIALVSVCSIALAHEANHGNPNWSADFTTLAFNQGLMVVFGIFFGLIVNWYIWPYEARVELRKGLSDLMLNMGILYNRLVEVFKYSNGTSPTDASNKSSVITEETMSSHYYTDFKNMDPRSTYDFFVTFESKIHLDILRLDQLIPLTWLEPRLKGPFPVELYKSIVKKCIMILDKFGAMRIALGNSFKLGPDDMYKNSLKTKSSRGRARTLPDLTIFNTDLILGPARKTKKDPKYGVIDTESHDSIPQFLLPYRKELVGAVLLTFYVYSTSLILKQPLPTYLPPMKQTRVRLMDELNRFIRSNMQRKGRNQVPATIRLPEQFINYYAYSSAMEDVIIELEELGVLIKSLFGEMFSDVVPDETELMDVAVDADKEPLYVSSQNVYQYPHSSLNNRMSAIKVDDEEYTETGADVDESDWWRVSGNWMV